MSAATHPPTGIPSSARLARHTTWNLFGMTLPMLVALVTIPLLIEGLGDGKFGVLSLIWVLVGYFSIFDFGMGRALTRMVAESLGAGRTGEIPGIFWTFMILMACIGTMAGILVAALAPWLAYKTLNIEPSFQAETCRALYVVAACVPVVTSTVGLIGMLEAHHRFGLLNAIRLPMGIFTFAGPLLVLPFTTDMMAVVGVLMVARLLICGLYITCMLRIQPVLRCLPTFDRNLIKPLATFGGWMTVSNITLPLILQLDRWLLGTWISTVAVAFYTVASEVVVRLLVIPRSWVSTLFPVFSAHHATNPEQTRCLFLKASRYLLLFIYPAVLGVVIFADEGLLLWLGPDYADQSAGVMKILAVGMLFASLALIPASLLQAMGHPRHTATAHVLELVLFLITAWFLATRFGINGMAMACLLRSVIDLLLMYGFASLHVHGLFRASARSFAALALGVVGVWLLWEQQGVVAGALMYAGAIGAWLAYSWIVLLDSGERRYLLSIPARLIKQRCSSARATGCSG